jgi:hypothetical protein
MPTTARAAPTRRVSATARARWAESTVLTFATTRRSAGICARCGKKILGTYLSPPLGSSFGKANTPPPPLPSPLLLSDTSVGLRAVVFVEGFFRGRSSRAPMPPRSLTKCRPHERGRSIRCAGASPRLAESRAVLSKHPAVPAGLRGPFRDSRWSAGVHAPLLSSPVSRPQRGSRSVGVYVVDKLVAASSWWPDAECAEPSCIAASLPQRRVYPTLGARRIRACMSSAFRSPVS